MRILMLTTDGYGCLGGIAQLNRDLLRAFDAIPTVERVVVWPRRAGDARREEIPESVVYQRRFAGGRWRYAWAALVDLLQPRHYDLVLCAHLHLLPFAWLAAKRRGAKLALLALGIESWRPPRNALSRLLANRIDYLLSISRFTEAKFLDWARPRRVDRRLLPPCVDLARFKPAEKSPALLQRYGLERRLIVMTMGRLAQSERYKGVDELIDLAPRLFERFPDAALLIVGDGDDRARLTQKALDRGVADRVVFAGRIDEEEKAAHLQLADVFSLAGSGEGFGVVLIEAAACGAPVIGSTLDGSREAALDGALGAVVDPRDAAALLDTLTAALTRSTRARHDAIHVYSSDAFDDRVAAWLADVMKARGAR